MGTDRTTNQRTDQPMDEPTNGPTNTVSYRGACSCLKTTQKQGGRVRFTDTLSITLIISCPPTSGMVCSNIMVEHFFPWWFMMIEPIRGQDSRCMGLGLVSWGLLILAGSHVARSLRYAHL
jgi:hypothetical protein